MTIENWGTRFDSSPKVKKRAWGEVKKNVFPHSSKMVKEEEVLEPNEVPQALAMAPKEVPEKTIPKTVLGKTSLFLPIISSSFEKFLLEICLGFIRRTWMDIGIIRWHSKRSNWRLRLA